MIIQYEYFFLGALLRAFIIDDPVYDEVLFLEPSDFQDEMNKKIYEVMLYFVSQDIKPDMVMIDDEYGKRNRHSALVKLSDIYGSHYSMQNIVMYAETIREHSKKRKIQNLHEILNEKEKTVSEIDYNVRTALDKIQENETGKGRDIESYVSSFMSILSDRCDKNKEMVGISTGLIDIDKATNGFQPGQLIVIAARPGMGKTTLALNIATNEILNGKGSVAFFSLEMTGEAILERIISSELKIKSTELLNAGSLSSEKYGEIMKLSSVLIENNNLHIHCEDDLEKIMAICRIKKRKQNLSLIVIDYLGLLLTGKHEHAHLIIGEITRKLKKLAMKLEVPIILLSQMNRSIENRIDKRPLLSDLRQSGSIEQDADIVMFISQDQEASANQFHPMHGYSLLSIAKNRNGPVSDIILKFKSEIFRFESCNVTDDQYRRDCDKEKKVGKMSSIL
jgi:replicative DNA helicase